MGSVRGEQPEVLVGCGSRADASVEGCERSGTTMLRDRLTKVSPPRARVSNVPRRRRQSVMEFSFDGRSCATCRVLTMPRTRRPLADTMVLWTFLSLAAWCDDSRMTLSHQIDRGQTASRRPGGAHLDAMVGRTPTVSSGRSEITDLQSVVGAARRGTCRGDLVPTMPW